MARSFFVTLSLINFYLIHVNAHKTEYMCFNQTGDISTLNSSSLKLVDKFTYTGSSVSSTGTDIDSRLTKAQRAPRRLLVIWMSDLTDKKKQSCRYCYMDALHGRWQTDGEKTWRQLHKNVVSNIQWVLEATLHKAAAIRPLTTHHEN